MAEIWYVQIETGNAAFDDSPATEIARILRDLARRFEEGGVDSEAVLRDINGNKVGCCYVCNHRLVPRDE
ncbi:MAG: hypothetical protein NTV19_00010 [Burkholderiales bacterium]|nr:hypothetical protein [Burkholderiales bacterium]